MRKTNVIFKISSLVFALVFVLTAFSGCKKDMDEEQPVNNEVIDLSGFNIIRDYGLTPSVNDDMTRLKDSIKKKLGIEMSVKIDLNATEADKEILVGNTNRAATTAALEKLASRTSEESYIIEITDTKIVIAGTTEAATVRAIKVFIYDYINASSEANLLNVAAGKTYADLYNTDKITTLENGVDIETVVSPKTLFSATGSTDALGYTTDATSAHYPSIIELQHQQNSEDNGKLIAHFCLRDSATNTDACFMQSDDGGKTWSLLSRPEEQKSPELTPGQMSHLYELPAQLGDFPAGTLVYANGSINYSIRSEIWIWYSTDCGKTWTQTALIAKGGAVNSVPGWPDEQSGVWEPFTWYEDGYLYCFYSDDSDPAHSQKIVYRRSKDGINWESIVDVCTFDDPEARPGMFVMTKMGNGEYFMVYEYVNDPDKPKAPVYYKTTKDITEWNPEDKGTLIEDSKGTYPGSAPGCIWVPTGGECGTLIVSATSTATDLFISFDYGETWTTFANPLPYTSKGVDSANGKPGYSASFCLGADQRTVYFLNTTNIGTTGRCRIQFTSFRIY